MKSFRLRPNHHNEPAMLRLRHRHGAAGYGIYILILELLAEADSHTLPAEYDIIAYRLHEDEQLVRSVVEDFGLFEKTDDGKSFHSPDITAQSAAQRRPRRKAEEGTELHGSEKLSSFVPDKPLHSIHEDNAYPCHSAAYGGDADDGGDYRTIPRPFAESA